MKPGPRKAGDGDAVTQADHAWPAALKTLVEVFQALFKRRGRTPPEAAAEARAVVTTLAEYLGGRMFYLPRGDRLKCALRDQQIAARLGKEKGPDLALEYGLTLSQIYRIARKQRALGRARRNASSPQ